MQVIAQFLAPIGRVRAMARDVCHNSVGWAALTRRLGCANSSAGLRYHVSTTNLHLSPADDTRQVCHNSVGWAAISSTSRRNDINEPTKRHQPADETTFDTHGAPFKRLLTQTWRAICVKSRFVGWLMSFRRLIDVVSSAG